MGPNAGQGTGGEQLSELALVEDRDATAYGFTVRARANGPLHRIAPMLDPRQPRFWCVVVSRYSPAGLAEAAHQWLRAWMPDPRATPPAPPMAKPLPPRTTFALGAELLGGPNGRRGPRRAFMPRVVLSLAEWQAVAHELAGKHTALAPPGLLERVRALLAHAPQEWPDQAFALEVDESSAEAVRAVHAALTGQDRRTGQQTASVAEANKIIHDHQQRG